MKTWIITEEEIRDFINNANECLRSCNYGNETANFDDPQACIVRTHVDKNPIFYALFWSACAVQPHSSRGLYLRHLIDELEHVINQTPSPDRHSATRQIPKIFKRAIEVNQECK